MLLSGTWPEGGLADGLLEAQAGSYDTLPNGMPILHSHPLEGDAPAAIFLDFDGYDPSGLVPYSDDGDPSTFNTSEQAGIYEVWRYTAAFYSQFDIDVTTIQPNVYNQPTAWHVITSTYDSGGLAFDIFPQDEPISHSGVNWTVHGMTGVPVHEVGHNFGCGHTAQYDVWGDLTQDPMLPLDSLHGGIMGGGGATIDKWSYWHADPWVNPGGPSYLQDEVSYIAGLIDANSSSADGFRPDDYGGTIGTATAMTVDGTTRSATGIIERLTDADAFSFTVTSAGRYSLVAGREYGAGVDLKISLYNASSTLIAAEDGDPENQPYCMVNDQYLTLDLTAGTYYVIAESHGDYDDLGQYNVRVDPLPADWSLEGVGLPAIPGYATYSSGTYTLAGTGYYYDGNDYSNIGTSDDGGRADSFQYLYQTLQGDGSITVRVTGQTTSIDNAKAGIMIRDSLDSGAKSASLVLAPSSRAYFYYRSSTGGTTSNYYRSSTSAPYYLRLTRSDDSFTAQVSSTGSSWTTVGSSRTISMGDTVYIGLVSSSNVSSKGYASSPFGPELNVATFTSVSLSGTLNPGPTLNGLAAPSGLTVTGKTASSISLSWSDISGESGYSIERSSDGINYEPVGTTAAGVTTYTDSALTDPESGLPLYQPYFYRVRAQGSGGTVSQPSNVVNTTSRAGPVSSLVVSSISSSQLVIDWRDASGETGYRVERSPNGTSSWTTVDTVGQNVPSFTNSGLTAATQYYYRVVTLDGSGDAAVSTVVSNTTRLADLSGLTFTTKDSYQMAFAWNAVAGATRYQVERSTNGTSYTTLTSTLTATNYTDNNVVPMGEYYYRVTAFNANTKSDSEVIFAAAPAPSALPTPWLTADIGSVGATGAAKYNNGTFTIVGSGFDIYNRNDHFRYVYQTIDSTNFSYTVRVASMENTDYWAKAGLMIRASTADNAMNAMIYLSPHSAIFAWRSSTNGYTYDTNGTSQSLEGITAPYYLRITRNGSSFAGEVSPNGVSGWVQVGDAVSISMSSSVLVGFAACSHNDTLLNTETFVITPEANTAPTVAEAASATPNPVVGATTTTLSALGADDHGEANLTYTWTATSKPSGAPTPTYSVNRTNAAKNTTVTVGMAGDYTFRVTMTDTSGLSVTSTVDVTVNQTVPDPWQSQDVGSVGIPGSAGYNDGTFTVLASGADIWGTADEFHFVYQELLGDGSIIAQVATLENTNDWAKAGVMIRESLAADSRYAFTMVTPGNGTRLQSRATTGGSAVTNATGPSVTAPYWVKLARVGDAFTSQVSPDGTSWTTLGSTTITMGSTVYVGLALTSHNDSVLNTSTFTDVTVKPLPDPWESQDVGAVAAAGTAAYDSGTFTIEGSGENIYNYADEFHYVYQTLTGNGRITARVVSIEDTGTYAKAGVMMRQTLSAGSINVATLVTSGDGVWMQYRASTDGMTQNPAENTSLEAPYWVRLTRWGDMYVSEMSPDGTAWTTLDSVSLSMSSTIYVGLPVTSYNDGELCTAVFTDVSVEEYRLPGDANYSGTVDEADAAIVADHWGMSGMTWSEGDFNNDGKVGVIDAAILAANWGATLPTEAQSPGPSALSEPLIGPLPADRSATARQLIRPPSSEDSSMGESAVVSSLGRDTLPANVSAAPTVQDTEAVRDIALAEDYGPQLERMSLRRQHLAWSHTLARWQGHRQHDETDDKVSLATDLLLADRRM